MEIRRATLEDLGTLMDFRMEFIDLIKENVLPETFRQTVQDYLIAHLEWDDFLCYIVEENGEILSGAMLSVYEVLPNPGNASGKCGHLFNVYTRKKHRRKGYAAAVLKKILAEAKALSLEEIRLTALDGSEPLYENLGFRFLKKEMLLILTEHHR